MEIWKNVPGMEGLYQVSNFGRIKSLARTIQRNNKGTLHTKEHFVKGSKDTKGYLQLDAKIDGKRVLKFIHRIVAEAFLDNTENLEQVNHKDGNKLNNCVENLEWVTCKDNIHHAWNNGLNRPQKGEKHANHKLTEEQVAFIKEHYKKGNKEFGASALAKRFNVTKTPIVLIVKGKAWKHIVVQGQDMKGHQNENC